MSGGEFEVGSAELETTRILSLVKEKQSKHVNPYHIFKFVGFDAEKPAESDEDVRFKITEEEIKRRFKKLAIVLHPDRNQIKGAEEAFQLLSYAHEILSNPQKKEILDSRGSYDDTEFRIMEDPDPTVLFDFITQTNVTKKYGILVYWLLKIGAIFMRIGVLLLMILSIIGLKMYVNKTLLRNLVIGVVTAFVGRYMSGCWFFCMWTVNFFVGFWVGFFLSEYYLVLLVKLVTPNILVSAIFCSLFGFYNLLFYSSNPSYLWRFIHGEMTGMSIWVLREPILMVLGLGVIPMQIYEVTPKAILLASSALSVLLVLVRWFWWSSLPYTVIFVQFMLGVFYTAIMYGYYYAKERAAYEEEQATSTSQEQPS